jgi:hypothetical protein
MTVTVVPPVVEVNLASHLQNGEVVYALYPFDGCAVAMGDAKEQRIVARHELDVDLNVDDPRPRVERK